MEREEIISRRFLMEEVVKEKWVVAQGVAYERGDLFYFYCNNLLFNIPAYKLNKLQTLQNAVACCVFKLHRRSTDSIRVLSFISSRLLAP